MKAKKKSRKFNVLDKVILGLNIIAVLLLLLSYLAPGTNPRDSVLIAILGFGYIYIAIGTFLFVFYWLLRKPVLVLISIIAILAGAGTIKSYIGFNGKTQISAKPPGDNLRIMQYNVHGFDGIDRYAGTTTRTNVTSIIADKSPDIITMVEYKKIRGVQDTLVDSLKKLCGFNYNYFQSFLDRGVYSSGNIIYSKYPIVKAGPVDSTFLLNTRAIYADILYKGKKIRIYSLHLAAVEINMKQKNKYLNGALGLDNISFIQGKLSGAFISRSYQVSLIKKHIENCPYPYIITGDFNDTPNSFAVNEISDGLQNAFVEKGSGFLTTYYARFPLQIDYIFAGEQFDILNYQLVDKKLSDHKPVLSDLRLK